jgi:phosphoesterase RecJ-like protein
LPAFAPELPGFVDIVVFPARAGERQQLRPIMREGDALVVMDTPTANRMAAFYDTHRKVIAGATVVNIDHHISNTRFGTHNFVDPTAAATAEVVVDVLDASEMAFGPEAAKCLMTALIADTQCFRTENTSPRSLLLAHRLWLAGAPIYPIAQSVLATRPLSALRLWGTAVGRMGAQDGVVWAAVTDQMLEDTGATMEEVEGLVDFLLSAKESRAAIVFKEQGPDETKISVRTLPGVDAIKIVSGFGGGGHTRSAGCTIFADSQTAADQLLPIARAEAKAGGRS